MKPFLYALLLAAMVIGVSAADYQVNVQNFGAYPGNADNTAAIQRALDTGAAIGSATVVFPVGVYRHKGTLKITGSTSMEGAGAPMIDATGNFQGSWLSYTGTTPGAYQLIITNGTANVTENGTFSTIAFLGNNVAKGILCAPAAHPQAQHSFTFDKLRFYRNKIAMTFGESITDNQTDFHIVTGVTADECDGFVETSARNFTCVTFIGCHSALNSTTAGIHYNIHAGNIIKLLNCAGGYGAEFVHADELSGQIDMEGCQWEGTTAANPYFFSNTSPGFGNQFPFNFINCVIGNPIYLGQNDRTVTLIACSKFAPVIVAAETVQVEDTGGVQVNRDSGIVNGNFTTDLSGWTQSNWHWGIGASGNGVAFHNVGFTNAISQNLAVKDKWIYTAVFFIQASTAGSITPYLGTQQGSTYGSGVFSQSWTNNQGDTTVPITFFPTSDFNGSIDAISMTYRPPNVIDTVNSGNYYLTPNLFKTSPNYVNFGGNNGVMTSSGLFQFNPTNRLMTLGDIGHQANVSIGDATLYPSKLYISGDDAVFTLINPAGGSVFNVGSGGAYSGFLLDDSKPFFIGTQNVANKGTFLGYNRGIELLQNSMLVGFDGTQIPSDVIAQQFWVYQTARFGAVNLDGNLTFRGLARLVPFSTGLSLRDSTGATDADFTARNGTFSGTITASLLTLNQLNTGNLLTTNGVVYVAQSTGPTPATIIAGNAAIWASNSSPAKLYIRTTTDGSTSTDTPIATGGSASTGANPSASVGLAAVNGVATTFLRSDGAPALDQSISPTWTGTHTFSGKIRTPRTALTHAGTMTFDFNGASTFMKCSLTGNVTIATTGLAADRIYSMRFLNPQTTNITIAYPQASGTNAWRMVGGPALTLSAGQYLYMDLESDSTTDTSVIAKISPESQP